MHSHRLHNLPSEPASKTAGTARETTKRGQSFKDHERVSFPVVSLQGILLAAIYASNVIVIYLLSNDFRNYEQIARAHQHTVSYNLWRYTSVKVVYWNKTYIHTHHTANSRCTTSTRPCQVSCCKLCPSKTPSQFHLFYSCYVPQFQSIADQLFQSFNSSISVTSFDTLSSCIISWLEEYCKPQVQL